MHSMHFQHTVGAIGLWCGCTCFIGGSMWAHWGDGADLFHEKPV